MSELKTLIDDIRTFSYEVLNKEAREFDQSEAFPSELVNELTKQHILHLLLENNHLKGNYRDFLKIIRILSKQFASLGSIILTQAACGVWPIYIFGTQQQKRLYLDKALAGDLFISLAVNEMDSGSQIENVQTEAVEIEEGWRISGIKHSISNASVASLFLIFAKIKTKDETDLRNGQYGIFLIDRHTSGLSVTEPEKKMGIRALPVSNIILESVEVGKDSLLGGRIDGEHQIENIFNKLRMAIAAQAIGISQGALEKGLKYVSFERKFGQRLIDAQNTQIRLAEAEASIAAARALLIQVYEESPEDTRKVSMVKLISSDVAIEATETIMQLTGGYGYMRNNDIERYIRDAKMTAIYGGSSASQKRIISAPWVVKK